MASPARAAYNTNNWDAIDIYVFANGEQYSPPRKYHLGTEELSLWKATLNSLARSQYGSLHSMIELYTTEGKKLDGPIELQNGTAYVAVEPPDVFIDTGYDNYLIKASRSWEKRHTRKNGSNEIIKSVSEAVNVRIDSKNKVKSELKFNSADRKTHVENPIMIIRNAGDETSKIFKPLPDTNNESTYQRTSINSKVQRSNERKRQVIAARPAITKKNIMNLIVSPPPPPPRRTSLKVRNSPTKRFNNRKSVKDKGKPVRNTTEKNMSLLHPKFKRLNKIEDTLPTIQRSNVEKASMERSITELGTKLMLTEDANTKNCSVENNQKENVSTLYKNRKSEFPSIILDKDLVKLRSIENENIEYSNNLASEIEEMLNDQIEIHSKEQLDQKSCNEAFTNTCACDKEISCNNPYKENYTAVINKGDLLNLNLKIEVTNADSYNTSNTVKYTSHSIVNSVKLEKTLQVSGNKHILLNKSVQSMLGNDECTQIEENDKLIVVHCQCCVKHDCITNNDAGDKKYIIVLTNTELKESLNRCKCTQDEKNKETIKEKNNSVNKSDAAIHSLKRTLSFTSVGRLAKLTTDTSLRSHGDTDMLTEDKYSSPHVNVVIKPNVSIAGSQNEKPECGELKSNFSKLVEEVDPKLIDESPKMYIEKSTQTEWCDILVEAKSHNDGFYSFHLPPIQAIKYYKL